VIARVGIARSKSEKRFLEHVYRDLNGLDHHLEYREVGKYGQLFGGIRARNNDDLAAAIRKRTSNLNDPHFKVIEAQFYDNFLSGLSSVDVNRIDPVLEVNQVPRKDATLEYLRHIQSIRSAPGVGEPLLILIRDQGNHGRPLMGAVALGYAQYFQGERDFFLGWAEPKISSQAQIVREKGLERIAQITTIVAMPPYDQFRVLRLLAPTPFTRQVMGAFRRLRKRDLSAAICIAALRDHFPALEGHSLADLTGKEKSPGSPDTLYTKVQMPVRKRMRVYDTISEETKIAAAKLWKRESGGDKEPTWRQQLHYAFRVVVLPLGLLDTNAIATYVGALSDRQLNSLRFNLKTSSGGGLAFERIVGSWKKFLEKKYAGDRFSGRLVIPNPRRLLVSERGHTTDKTPEFLRQG
jgi:hypothetical protein